MRPLTSASASNLDAGTAAVVAQSAQGPRPPSGHPLTLGTLDRCRHGISPCRLGFVNMIALYGHYYTRVEMREAASCYYQAAPSPTTDPLKPLEMQSYFEDVPYKTLYIHFDERDGAPLSVQVQPHACIRVEMREAATKPRRRLQSTLSNLSKCTGPDSLTSKTSHTRVTLSAQGRPRMREHGPSHSPPARAPRRSLWTPPLANVDRRAARSLTAAVLDGCTSLTMLAFACTLANRPTDLMLMHTAASLARCCTHDNTGQGYYMLLNRSTRPPDAFQGRRSVVPASTLVSSPTYCVQAYADARPLTDALLLGLPRTHAHWRPNRCRSISASASRPRLDERTQQRRGRITTHPAAASSSLACSSRAEPWARHVVRAPARYRNSCPPPP
ncbi:hypothetical protein PsYK624_160830 [Phanerochaete sordida]|uniref:Uncharacterized protein n=1 Tax=Phanerochaete sordida TaxID=48140 RepID=A0A9P3GQB1_9APHY|nr:hypothetical protein PsYK624_160830 [Phanerochaete sordida]